MNLLLERKYCKEKYTVGRLFIDGVFFSNTLEDKVRDINKNGKFDNGEFKVYAETAIPYGEYEITLDVVSPKFSKYQFYKEVCKGKLPRLLNVPDFEGVLIHCAEGPKGADLLQGCIAVGNNTIKGGLTSCKETFKRLYSILNKANKNNEKITITII
jgi:hypothetical protein